jgi:hypothetical protein
MNKRNSINPAILMISISIFVLIIVAPTVFAGGPAPGLEGVTFEGKSVDGVLNAVVVNPADYPSEALGFYPDIFSDGAEPFVLQYIVLTCKDAEKEVRQVVFGPDINFPSTSPDNLKEIKAECTGEVEPGTTELCLEGWIFGGAAVEEPQSVCFPERTDLGSNDIVITKVKNFVNTGTAISAEVTLQLGQQ